MDGDRTHCRASVENGCIDGTEMRRAAGVGDGRNVWRRRESRKIGGIRGGRTYRSDRNRFSVDSNGNIDNVVRYSKRRIVGRDCRLPSLSGLGRRRRSGGLATAAIVASAAEDCVVAAHHMTGGCRGLVAGARTIAGCAGMTAVGAKSVRPAIVELLAVDDSGRVGKVGSDSRSDSSGGDGRRCARLSTDGGVGTMVAGGQCGQLADAFLVRLEEACLISRHRPIGLVEVSPLLHC